MGKAGAVLVQISALLCREKPVVTPCTIHRGTGAGVTVVQRLGSLGDARNYCARVSRGREVPLG